MQKRLFAALSLVAGALSACTLQQTPAGNQVEFTPPIVPVSWAARPGRDAATGQPYCLVTGGHSSISVQLMKGASGEFSQLVKSERDYEPGTEITLNVNNHFYRTQDTVFPARDAAAIVADMHNGTVAYAEWNEPQIKAGGHAGYQRFNNTLQLGGFAQAYDACVRAL